MNNFVDDFKELCFRKKEQIILIYDTGEYVKQYTYMEAYDLVQRWGGYFEEVGLKCGDVIISLLPNSPEAIFSFWAALSFGYYYAPLPCKATEREINKWRELLSGKLLLKKTEIESYSLSCFKNILLTNCDGNMSDWLPKVYGKQSNMVKAKLLLHTSGSTGTPKAMRIDADTLWNAGIAFSNYYNLLNMSPRFWNYLPVSYLGGLFNLAMIPLCCGGSFLVTEPFSGKTMLNFWNVIKRHDIDSIWFVPTIVHGLLKMNGIIGEKYKCECHNTIKRAFIGTAPIHLKDKLKFEELIGIKIYENYALSETTFITAETERNLLYRMESSVGTLLPYVEKKLQPYNGSTEIFELWIKTPFLFDGYLNKDGLFNINLDDDGFFNTKDLVSFQKNGEMILQGRDRDIIKKGGLFVSLKEIEYLIAELQEIDEVVAVAVSNEYYGEAYLLFIRTEQKRRDLDLKENVRLWIKNNLIAYKWPEEIIVCDDIPKTDSGKIKKGDLIEKYGKKYK